jgi:transcriptional regulator with XRE-family HTH domain
MPNDSRAPRPGTLLPNGEAIEYLREQKGLSQEKLAQQTGLSKNTIGNAESSKPVYAHTLRCLANFFDVPLSELLKSPAAPPIPERDVLHLEDPTPHVDKLPVEFGFLRGQVTLEGDPTDPIFFGCRSALLALTLQGGRSKGDPKIVLLPRNGGLKACDGVGSRPWLRLEAEGEPFVMEGGGHVVFAIDHEGALAGTVLLEPKEPYSWKFGEDQQGRREVLRCYDIVAKAQVRRFLQTVVRHFSYGESL